jgi:hypothetical protein
MGGAGAATAFVSGPRLLIVDFCGTFWRDWAGLSLQPGPSSVSADGSFLRGAAAQAALLRSGR